LGDDDLANAVGQLGPRGVDGQLKNIIFASVGPKPRIVLKDAVNNVIDIVEHRESCLVYDRELSQSALTWGDLVEWWRASWPSADPARDLYQRLYRSLASPPEQLLFRTYCQRYRGEAGREVPALLPQVYLHYDPYTRAERRQREGELKRERMDFLLLLPSGARVVLEVDGQQHYADDDGKASPRKYSEMVAEDRRIRLNGYEVYRFGGSELARSHAEAELVTFVNQLLAIHVS
jgi:very-short-patch-repair endonuclease